MNPTLFRFASSAAMCLTMAGVLAAQSPPQPPSTSQPDQSRMQSRDNGATVTVVGCLMQEKDVAALNQTASGGTGDGFVLTNAKPATAAGTPNSTSPSATAPAESGQRAGMGRGMNNMFKVVGLTDELSKHVNHQVEVQGTIAGRERNSGSGGAMGSATGSPTGSAGAGAGTGAGSGAGTGATSGTSASGQGTRQGGRQMGVPELRATSVRMLSATCPTSTPQQ